MILRQKKSTETEKNMEENKKKVGWKYLLSITAVVIIGASGMWLLGSVRSQAEDRLLANCVMTVLLLALTGFHLGREYLYNCLDYDNGEHLFRYLLCTGIGLITAFICGFLPVGGWPFLMVYVMLSLFSNMSTGILTASSLLLISVLLNGAASEGFLIYFVSGIFAVTLFRHLESDFKIGIPLFLSLMCLLVCETANLILAANARPDIEMFVIPVANMIISSILLLGCLKLFSSMVVYRYRDKYLDINDTENPTLVALKEKDRKEYMLCVHTAYFCERIAGRLGLDVDALKCAGYYHRPGDELPKLMEEKQFPPAVREILLDYLGKKQGIQKKETAVLLCSDTIVSSVTYLMEKGEQHKVDFDKVIDVVFRKMAEDGTFDKCDISVSELKTMQVIFKEEKLYYDFLR